MALWLCCFPCLPLDPCPLNQSTLAQLKCVNKERKECCKHRNAVLSRLSFCFRKNLIKLSLCDLIFKVRSEMFVLKSIKNWTNIMMFVFLRDFLTEFIFLLVNKSEVTLSFSLFVSVILWFCASLGCAAGFTVFMTPPPPPIQLVFI